MLNIDDIKYTLNTLYKGGKVIPTNEIEEMANFWLEIFKTTSLPLWQRATRIALTMTSAGKINVNIATPALMTEALKLAEQEHVDRQIKEAKELDKPAPDEMLGDYARKQFVRWTRARAQQMGFSFVEYRPTDEQLQAKLAEIKAANTSSNRMLVKMYLIDVNMGAQLKYTLAVKDGDVYYKGI